MLDAVLEDACFTPALGLGVLLGAKDKGLGTVFTVNLIQHLIEAFHLFMTF